MILDSKGLLIVISGPSGVGKGTVRKKVFEAPNNKFAFSISMTTRKPRIGEVDGVDYWFVSKEEFEESIKNDNLIEHAVFVDNYYGTPKDKVYKLLNEGYDVFLEIDVQGALQIKEKMKDQAVLIFIAPPSLKELRKRLKSRGTETIEVIEKRLSQARGEINQVKNGAYDYLVINESVDTACEEVLSIIQAEHKKSNRIIDKYIQLMEE